MKTNSGRAFRNFLRSLKAKPTVYEKSITFSIYLVLFEMRMAMWDYCVSVSRYKEHSFADYFQDIVAQYIGARINRKYKLSLEEKSGKYQPDIIIRNRTGNLIVAIIEIKTTVGWNRTFITESEYEKRIEELSCEYEIEKDKIFFIFESSGNVNNEFRKEIEKVNNKYIGKIYPLFKMNAHPKNIFGKGWNEIKSSPKEFYYKTIWDYYRKSGIECNSIEKILKEKSLT